MSWDQIRGIGSFNIFVPVDPMAYQQQMMTRQSMLQQNCFSPIAQPSVQEIAMLQGFYNGCLGNIDTLRYGCNFPSMMGLMSQNPQMMIMFMMYQQMQMQNMMLMMLLMQQNAATTQMLLKLLASRGLTTQGSSGSSPYQGYTGSSLPTPETGGQFSSANKAQVNNLIENAAQKYGIPPDILKSIAWQESRWNPNAVGDGGKSFGMMQIYTSAHPDYKVSEGRNNIAYNVEYGARLLRSLYDRYGSWEKAVERYNGSGPMAVKYASSVMNHAQSKPWLA